MFVTERPSGRGSPGRFPQPCGIFPLGRFARSAESGGNAADSWCFCCHSSGTTLALSAGESRMFRAPALVVILAVSLVAGRSGHLCGVTGIEGHQPATCDHPGGHSSAATSGSQDGDGRDCVAARQSFPQCAEGDITQRGIRLESVFRVRQAFDEGRPGDTGAALAPLTYRLSLRVDVHTPRRQVEERVPLERRPLSTNLRI